MAPSRYVALLRGINVGGRNLVAMSDLRAAFEEDGHRNVSTYIQSGNVIFETELPSATIESHLEAMLERTVGLPLTVVVRSRRRMSSVVARAPESFGSEPDRYRYDVVFLKRPLTASAALKVTDPRVEVDEVTAGSGVLYWRRLTERATQSRIGRIVTTPEYQQMTIRNWATTTRLRTLVQ